MTVSIHQPNFMPWYPFFQKVESADVFILLSHCQFEKNGFQNRFNFDGKWYTMSTNKGLEPIYKKRYVNAASDWEKIKNSLIGYRKVLSIFDDCISESLVDTNTKIILKIAEMLNIPTRIVPDYETDLQSTKRLVRLCKDFNADKYISGISGKKYLDISLFEKEGIEVEYQEEKAMSKKAIIEILNKINLK